MKKLLLFSYVFLAFYRADAQENTVVSFGKDTAEIKRLINQTKELRHVATDSAIKNLWIAYRLSTETRYVEGIARALINLGLMYMDKGNYRRSLQLYNTAIPYAHILALTNPKGIVLLYNNIAAVYGNRNVIDSAAIYYYKALAKFEQYNVGDTALLLSIYCNLGGRLTTLERTQEARYYLDLAMLLAKATDNIAMLAKVYAAYTGVYSGEEKNIDSIRYYGNKALAIFKTVNDPASEITTYCNVGHTYLDEHNTAMALRYYSKALKVEKDVSELAYAPAYRGMGKTHLQLKNYAEAEKYYLKALELSRSVNSFVGINESYAALVAINIAKKNFKQAYEYRNEQANMSDSNLNAEKIHTFGQLEIKYRTSQKDKEIAEKKLLLVQKQNELTVKNFWLITVSILALLIIALLANIFRIRRQRQVLQILNLKNEKEMEQLKATMQGEERERVRIARELHDGIMIQFSSVKMNLSALNESGTLFSDNKIKQIIGGLDEAIKDLRKSAHNLMPDMLLKEGLTEAVHYFCVKLQEGTDAEIHFQSYGAMPSIAPEYELMIYRMVQELLQNTLKHSGAGKLLVQFNYQPDMISLTVEDDGKGFDTNVISLHKGMGLYQIRERIRSLNGVFQIYQNKPKGSSVYIELETKNLQPTDTTQNAYKRIYN